MHTNERMMLYRSNLQLILLLLFCGSILSGCAAGKYGWQTQKYAAQGWMAFIDNDTTDLSAFKRIQDVMDADGDDRLQHFFTVRGLPDWVFTPGQKKVYLAYLRIGIIFEHTMYSRLVPKEIHYTKFQNLPEHLTQKFRKEIENAGINSIDIEKENSTISSGVLSKPPSSTLDDQKWMEVVFNAPGESLGSQKMSRAIHSEQYLLYIVQKLGMPDYINESNDNKLYLAYLSKGIVYEYILNSGVFPQKIHYTEFQNSLPLSLYQKFRENNVKLVVHTQKPLPPAAAEVTSVEKKQLSEIPDVSSKQQTSSPALRAPIERRVALVIGNAGYKDAPPLRNPLNDARDMIQVLRDLNFETIEVSNGNKRQMIDAINAFGERLQQAKVGLFYYAGHGVQYQGKNYLIPVEAQIANATDLEHDSVDVDRILGQMHHARAALNIVILDACRNNPYRNFIGFRGNGESGLAQLAVLRSSPNNDYLIAYATQPNNVAEDGAGLNGTYTKHLLQYLKRPGLSLPDLFNGVGRSVSKETNGKQQPWVSSSSLPHFCFSGCDPEW